MRILILSADGGNGVLGWAMRCEEAGHKVKWMMSKPIDWRAQPIGKGLVDVVPKWQEWAKWPDLVFLDDNVKHCHAAMQFRARGVPVIGASPECAELELDRTLGQQFFKACGVKVADYKEFMEYDPAIAFVKKTMQRYVSKPLGDETDKALSYCAASPEDMVFMLERWKRAKRHKAGFILQDFVKGVETAIGGFLGPHGFNKDFCLNWETKKLFNGDKGPATGEMGTILTMVDKEKLIDKVLRPCEDRLVDMGYVGYVDANLIIDQAGNPWPLEWTMRPGWPTWSIKQALLYGDPAEWLLDLASGLDSRPWRLNEVAVGVVMALPDFPYSHFTRKEVTGIPLYGITNRNYEAINLNEAYMGEAPQEMDGHVVALPTVCSAGDYLCTVTGTGETIRKARDRAYRTLSQLSTPASSFYRTDIGNRLAKQLPEIQKHGYASNVEF